MKRIVFLFTNVFIYLVILIIIYLFIIYLLLINYFNLFGFTSSISDKGIFETNWCMTFLKKTLSSDQRSLQQSN